MVDAIRMLSAVLGIGALAALVVYVLYLFLRDALGAALKREVESYVEILKHDLQREALKADLTTKRMHEVYPELMDKLRRAEGALGELFVSAHGIPWSSLNEQDLLQLVNGLALPEKRKSALRESVRADPKKAGIRDLREARREVEIVQAQNMAQEVMNLLVLKGIFISEEVAQLAYGIHRNIVSALVDLRGSHELKDTQQAVTQGRDFFENARAAESQVSGAMERLRARMRAELMPRLAEPETWQRKRCWPWSRLKPSARN